MYNVIRQKRRRWVRHVISIDQRSKKIFQGFGIDLLICNLAPKI